MNQPRLIPAFHMGTVLPLASPSRCLESELPLDDWPDCFSPTPADYAYCMYLPSPKRTPTLAFRLPLSWAPPLAITRYQSTFLSLLYIPFAPPNCCPQHAHLLNHRSPLHHARAGATLGRKIDSAELSQPKQKTNTGTMDKWINGKWPTTKVRFLVANSRHFITTTLWEEGEKNKKRKEKKKGSSSLLLASSSQQHPSPSSLSSLPRPKRLYGAAAVAGCGFQWKTPR